MPENPEFVVNAGQLAATLRNDFLIIKHSLAAMNQFFFGNNASTIIGPGIYRKKSPLVSETQYYDYLVVVLDEKSQQWYAIALRNRREHLIEDILEEHANADRLLKRLLLYEVSKDTKTSTLSAESLRRIPLSESDTLKLWTAEICNRRDILKESIRGTCENLDTLTGNHDIDVSSESAISEEILGIIDDQFDALLTRLGVAEPQQPEDGTTDTTEEEDIDDTE